MSGRASVLVAALTVVSALAGGCRDEEAPAACVSVIDTWCGRFTTCFPEATRVECASVAHASLGEATCEAAVAVRSRDDLVSCRSAVEALPCESLRALPSACTGLFRH